jgi:pyridoxamine 5'-phosphate oxidase
MSSETSSIEDEISVEDPLSLFDTWLQQASENETNDPNAAALATATASGQPSVRMVLVKRVSDDRFCFFTNVESQKGRQLTENPQAALCFHWKSLRRQVRIEGPVSELSTDKIDAYFHSRARESQIGAAVSNQSRPLASRIELEEKARNFAVAHTGEIPRPPYWRGFQIHPQRIEFWIDGAYRLHDRFLFTLQGHHWSRSRLYP